MIGRAANDDRRAVPFLQDSSLIRIVLERIGGVREATLFFVLFMRCLRLLDTDCGMSSPPLWRPFRASVSFCSGPQGVALG